MSEGVAMVREELEKLLSAATANEQWARYSLEFDLAGRVITEVRPIIVKKLRPKKVNDHA